MWQSAYWRDWYGPPTRLKEHRAHGRKGKYEKSAIVKHSHAEDHPIREASEIFKHDTVPQDIGFAISDIWQLLLPPSPMGPLYPRTPPTTPMGLAASPSRPNHCPTDTPH